MMRDGYLECRSASSECRWRTGSDVWGTHRVSWPVHLRRRPGNAKPRTTRSLDELFSKRGGTPDLAPHEQPNKLLQQRSIVVERQLTEPMAASNVVGIE